TLSGVVDALARKGIAAVALKGPVLAHRLYADPTVRPSTDLDLLVDPSQLDDAARALVPLGYTLEGGADGRFFRDHHHHVHALHASLPPLELHFDAYRGFGTVLPAAPLLAASLACPLPEWTGARLLSPEDEFLYLAVHAAGHRFARLVWLLDLKLLLRQYPALDWNGVEARARSLSLFEVLSFACAELADLFDPPGPALARLTSHRGMRGVLARRLLGERPGHLTNAAADFAFHALLCDDLARTAAFSGRFARVKLLHEAPRRVRLALSI
ncbi:MAG: nucleotidyltransferase family protein, partial [Myxococcales bacterium]|nr:nucleotidyltransferase family protein [Myxococcales bacterium]